MLYCRIVVLIFFMWATIFMGCANIFPVFRQKLETFKVEQTLWHKKFTVGVLESKQPVSDSECDQYKLFFKLLERVSLAVVAVGIVLIAFAIAQMSIRRISKCLRYSFPLLVLLAFALSAGCLGLLVYGYFKGYCQDSSSEIAKRYAPFKDQGYSFAESFFLFVAACALFLISVFAQCYT